MEDNGGKWRNINEYGFIDINYLSNHAGAYTHFSGGGGGKGSRKVFCPSHLALQILLFYLKSTTCPLLSPL